MRRESVFCLGLSMVLCFSFLAPGCSNESEKKTDGGKKDGGIGTDGGIAGSGGSSATSGPSGAGGFSASGGSTATSGSRATGGSGAAGGSGGSAGQTGAAGASGGNGESSATGGSNGTGESSAVGGGGGSDGSGGSRATGGSTAIGSGGSGGSRATGGSSASGGSRATGGSSSIGGSQSSGGSSASGGSQSSGGSSPAGGSSVPPAGGSSGGSSSSGGSGGSVDAGPDGGIDAGVDAPLEADASADATEPDAAAPSVINYRIRTSYSEGSASFYVVDCVQAGTITRLNETDHITPPGDFLFRMKPGLADPNDSSLVSFESVSNPGYYLRIDGEHTNATRPVTTGAYAWSLNELAYDHMAWFDAFTDTTAFKADATFKKVAALNGDSTMFSLRWYVDDTRYLRHFHYHLFALSPTNEQENTDSSFAFEIPGVSYRMKTSYSEGADPFYVVDCVQAGTITRLNETDHITPADFFFHMRPGLADPNDSSLVSFESDSNPGYYLRIDSANLSKAQRSVTTGAYAWALGGDYTHLTWFDLFTDTAAFKNDATFKMTAALNGDATMSSLQWYNDNTRYLRHANYHVFALPPTSDLERTDSSFTFEVVQP